MFDHQEHGRRAAMRCPTDFDRFGGWGPGPGLGSRAQAAAGGAAGLGRSMGRRWPVGGAAAGPVGATSAPPSCPAGESRCTARDDHRVGERTNGAWTPPRSVYPRSHAGGEAWSRRRGRRQARRFSLTDTGRQAVTDREAPRPGGVRRGCRPTLRALGEVLGTTAQAVKQVMRAGQPGPARQRPSSPHRDPPPPLRDPVADG